MLKNEEHKKAHFDTWEHIHEVRKNILKLQIELANRSMNHDISKMTDYIEASIFAEYSEILGDLEYGTEEYKENLAKMKPAIDLHHQNNRHHPEFHRDGINGMNLVDLIEMLCDWKAATKRTKGGNISYSLDVQKERFEISEQLMRILKNTLPLLEG